MNDIEYYQTLIRDALQSASKAMAGLHENLEHPTVRARLKRELDEINRMRERLWNVGAYDRPQHTARIVEDGGD